MNVQGWLLDSDPAIRWQAMRDLHLASENEYSNERARVSTDGLGARILEAQSANGSWFADGQFPEMSTLRALMLLRDMGIDSQSAEAKSAIQRVVGSVTWLMNIAAEELPKGETISWWHKPFFDGEVEPCINGRVVNVGSYFGLDVSPIVERLLGEQLSDGGWNCVNRSVSTRSSFNTTINVLEGLSEFQRAGGRVPVKDAVARGQEYLLSRRMFKRLTTGEPIVNDKKGGPIWTQYSYPVGWRYDILRGLDYLRSAGLPPETRIAESIDILSSQRNSAGWWALGVVHPEEFVAEPSVSEGSPSRWNTLRALRVLEWANVS